MTSYSRPSSDSFAQQVPPTVVVPEESIPATLDALDFGDAAHSHLVLPRSRPRLKWFNGASIVDKETLATGWHLEYGLDPRLDESLESLRMSLYLVEHQTPDPDGTRHKTYWHMHPCSLIVVAEGLMTPGQMRSASRQTGIAYSVELLRDTNGQVRRYDEGKGNIMKRRLVKCRAFVHELVLVGYLEWLPLTLSNRTADSFLLALERQFLVLKTFQEYQGRTAPFYGFSLPLVAGKRTSVQGRTGPTSPIYPITAAFPARIDQQYLLTHATPLHLVQQIHNRLLLETIEWSTNESRRITEGSSALADASEPDTLEPTRPIPTGPVPVEPPAPIASTPVGTASDRPEGTLPLPIAPPNLMITEDDVSWIRERYCSNRPEAVTHLCAYFQVETLDQLRQSQLHLLEARMPRS